MGRIGAGARARVEKANPPQHWLFGVHWCHVMARESFKDAATAALMNEWFVNVKVDREERPDRRNLCAGTAGNGPETRLAADDVSDAKRQAILGRNLFSAGRT